MSIKRAAWKRLASVIWVLGCLVSPAWAADHRDGPRIANNTMLLGNIDINDVYVFKAPAPGTDRTTLIMTLSPAAGLVGPAFFSHEARYEFHIDNNGDLAADVVYQVVFSEPNNQLRQSYQVYHLSPGTNPTIVSAGTTSIGTDKSVRISPIPYGGKAAAGLFQDPFFFDLLAFNKFLAAANKGMPLAKRVAAPFLPPNFPNDFFADFNVMAIVLEVPGAALRQRPKLPSITVWARTVADVGDGRGLAQYDRMGLPAINTAVIQPLQATLFPHIVTEDSYNLRTPDGDAALRPVAAARIEGAYGVTATYADEVAATVLPDVIPFNTTSRAGFLNGRQLADDVIDIELGLLTDGALKSDRVGNDKVFRLNFPYLGGPLPRQATLGALRRFQALEGPAQP